MYCMVACTSQHRISKLRSLAGLRKTWEKQGGPWRPGKPGQAKETGAQEHAPGKGQPQPPIVGDFFLNWDS